MRLQARGGVFAPLRAGAGGGVNLASACAGPLQAGVQAVCVQLHAQLCLPHTGRGAPAGGSGGCWRDGGHAARPQPLAGADAGGFCRWLCAQDAQVALGAAQAGRGAQGFGGVHVPLAFQQQIGGQPQAGQQGVAAPAWALWAMWRRHRARRCWVRPWGGVHAERIHPGQGRAFWRVPCVCRRGRPPATVVSRTGCQRSATVPGTGPVICARPALACR